MKNLTRIFVAVAAMVAVSCTTDVTEDLGVQIGAIGQTSIAISLEESRTQLGEKADGVYPLYWSTGDQIAVNGVASQPLTDESNGKPSATFTVNGELTYPYNVVYPAPAADVVAAEGLQAVTFMATQPYTAGTFTNGAAPMYAQVEAEGNAIALQHLTGILCLAVKGNGEVVKSMLVSTEKGKIAGNFDLNCADGTLTAHEDAANSVLVDFGEGLILGAEATPIYVAVPAGEYGIFTITLYTDAAENNAMIVRFNSDFHPVNVGKVKEFGEVAFMANATSDPVSGEFVIENEADMQRLAKLSEVEQLGAITSVRVAATIDMSNVKGWHGIERFPAITFDGGSDKGYEIKGLKAPLFGTVNGATIKNVKLTEVNINTADRNFVGALVCEYNGLSAENAITNCEVSGEIVVENKNYVAPTTNESLYNVVNVSGLVAVSNGLNISDCTNRANITVKQVASASSTTSINPTIGGVVGYAAGITLADESVLTCSATNCNNYGVIKYEDNSTELRYKPIIGGVIGLSATTAAIVFTNCNNYGEISINATTYGSTGASNSMAIAGVVGAGYKMNISNCENRAKITADGTIQALCIGGVVGLSSGSSTHDSLHNYGEVEVKESARILGIMAGGAAGALYTPNADTGSSTNITNNATLKVLASTIENTTKTGTYYYRVGGLTSFCRHSITNSTNNGDIITSGNIINLATGTERNIQIAGCVAYKTKGAVNSVKNYGDITVNNVFTTQSTTISVRENQPLAIAGIVADSSYSTQKCVNEGTITFGGQFTGYRVFIAGITANGIDCNVRPYPGDANDGDIILTSDAVFTLDNVLYVGGCTAGTESSAIDGLTNNGDIKLDCKIHKGLDTNEDGTIDGAICRIGGVFGYLTAAHQNLVNNGNIEFGENFMCEGDINLGGVVGYLYNKTNDEAHTYSGYTNNGKITFKGNNKGSLVMGGISGRPYGAYITNMTNNGEIELDGVYDGRLYVGGCFGFHDTDKIVTLKDIENKKPITVKGTYNNSEALILGGVMGTIQGAGPHTNIYNREGGDITVNLTKSVGNLVVGGVTTKFQDSSDTVENHGDINISGTYEGSIYMAGLVTYSNNYTRNKHVNYGNFTISSATIGSALIVGGMCSYGPYGKIWTEAHNYGDITVEADVEVSNGAYIGGMQGYFDSSSGSPTYTRSVNSGNIAYKGKIGVSTVAPSSSSYNKTHNLCIGGLFGQSRSNGSKIVNVSEGFINTGKIEFSGSNPNGSVYIGGVIGDMATPVSAWTGSLVNTGDIVCSGTYKIEGYVGGVFGKTSVAIPNGEVYFTLNAQNYTAGMITGSSRSETVKATNGKVGGSTMVYNVEDCYYKATAIPEDDYYKYIYGSGEATDWTGTDNYDGCTFLSVKPTFE